MTTNSFFKTLIDREVTVELKNDIQIRGVLKSVDQYLNIKLDDISVVDELKYPHLVSCLVRSNHIRSFHTSFVKFASDFVTTSVCKKLFANWEGSYADDIECRQEHLHTRIRRTVCPPTSRGGGYSPAGGRDEKR